MEENLKQLLLKDLCARLPYHPIVSVAYNYADKGIVWEFNMLSIKLLLEIEEEESWEYIKPYLRPLSNMTEEEADEFEKISNELLENGENTEIWDTVVDWLNAHYFDHRGLIEKSLAIVTPEGMYK